MDGNLTTTARAALVAAIGPQQAAVGTVTSPWIDMRDWGSLQALVAVGVFGAGATVDAKIEQATDSNGANAKAVPGLAITQLLAAGGNNRQAVINVRGPQLDKTGFRFVRLSVTIGGASTFVAGSVLGFDPRYNRASANQAASVAETIR